MCNAVLVATTSIGVNVGGVREEGRAVGVKRQVDRMREMYRCGMGKKT